MLLVRWTPCNLPPLPFLLPPCLLQVQLWALPLARYTGQALSHAQAEREEQERTKQLAGGPFGEAPPPEARQNQPHRGRGRGAYTPAQEPDGNRWRIEVSPLCRHWFLRSCLANADSASCAF